MALTSVRHEGRMLQFLGAKFRDDEEVARAAIRCTPCAIRWAGARLRHDWDLNLEAVLNHESAFSAVHESLSTYRAFCLACVKQDGHVLMEMAEELCADREIVLEAVSSWCPALKYASWSLREDPDFMLEVVRRDIRDGRSLKYVSEAIRCDPRIVAAARRVGISQYVP